MDGEESVSNPCGFKLILESKVSCNVLGKYFFRIFYKQCNVQKMRSIGRISLKIPTHLKIY